MILSKMSSVRCGKFLQDLVMMLSWGSQPDMEISAAQKKTKKTASTQCSVFLCVCFFCVVLLGKIDTMHTLQGGSTVTGYSVDANQR